MNLYKIKFTHYAPKDSSSGIKEFIIAQNEEGVFNYIDKNHVYDSWTEREDEWDNEDQTYKEFILENKGDDEDESLFENLYYGLTTYGWEIVEENIGFGDIKILTQLGIIENKGETE